MADLQQFSGFARRQNHLARALDRVRHFFFAIHMLARFQAINRDRRMVKVGRGDNHRFDARLFFQHLVIIDIRLHVLTIFLQDVGRVALGIFPDVADRDVFHAGNFQAVQQQVASLTARADDGDFDFLSFGRCFVFVDFVFGLVASLTSLVTSAFFFGTLVLALSLAALVLPKGRIFRRRRWLGRFGRGLGRCERCQRAGAQTRQYQACSARQAHRAQKFAAARRRNQTRLLRRFSASTVHRHAPRFLLLFSCFNSSIILRSFRPASTCTMSASTCRAVLLSAARFISIRAL